MPTISGIIVSTGTEAAGRRAFSDVIDELARPINAADTTIRALAADAFRAAVRTMNRRGCWPWEYQDQEVAMTANQKFSTVTGGAVKKPLSMHYLSASGGTPDERIWYVPYEVFMERNDQNVTCQPVEYTIPNLFETGQIQWCQIPASADVTRFTYYRVTPIPRNEDEPVEIPDFVTEVYMAFAWKAFAERCKAARAVLSMEAAEKSAKEAFAQLSAHVASATDTSRAVYGMGGTG